MVANPDFVDIEKLASADSMTFVVFIFSIKIGALITYLLKEALNLKGQFLLAMIESEKDNLTDDQKYELASIIFPYGFFCGIMD
jgi:hypothetical protein